MIQFLLFFLSWFGALFRSRYDVGLELVALRQQAGVLERKNPRPQLTLGDRLFWLGLRRCWSKWVSVLGACGYSPACVQLAFLRYSADLWFRKMNNLRRIKTGRRFESKLLCINAL